jgi:hypothetical protein
MHGTQPDSVFFEKKQKTPTDELRPTDFYPLVLIHPLGKVFWDLPMVACL